jgi:tmRNA-binding protein
MKNKKATVNFDLNDYNITAIGLVLNESEVYNLQWTAHNLEEELNKDTIELINNKCIELLIDKVFNPELEFNQ